MAEASPDPNDPLSGFPQPEKSDAYLDQDSIDELLKQASFEDPAAAGAASPPADDASGALPQDALDALAAALNEPMGLPAPAAQPSAPVMPDPAQLAALASAAAMELPNFQQVMNDAQASSIDMLRDVELNVKIELGRSRMLVEDVLKLAEGSVVELDKLAGDPVDVFVNDRLVARGEVLVLNDNFCVRVNEIVATGKEEGA